MFMPLIVPMAYVDVITRIVQIIGTIAASISIVIGIRKIIEAIKKPKGNEKQQKPKYFKIEKNAVPLPGIPMVKSPKGYVYQPDQHPKKRTLYCGNCYKMPSNLLPLNKTGGLFSKEMVCPACKTIYKR